MSNASVLKKFLLSAGFILASAAYVMAQLLGSGQPVVADTASPAQTQSAPAQNSFASSQTSAPAVRTTRHYDDDNEGGDEDSEGNEGTPVAVPAPTQVAQAQPAQTQAQPTQTVTPVQKTGQYTDGTYTGSIADAFYGFVQVQATVQGGTLTNVTFLQYPNDRSTSRMINNQAMPILTSEAIRAQSANVDIVSGATDTSQAFQQSLSSALAKAS